MRHPAEGACRQRRPCNHLPMSRPSVVRLTDRPDGIAAYWSLALHGLLLARSRRSWRGQAFGRGVGNTHHTGENKGECLPARPLVRGREAKVRPEGHAAAGSRPVCDEPTRMLPEQCLRGLPPPSLTPACRLVHGGDACNPATQVPPLRVPHQSVCEVISATFCLPQAHLLLGSGRGGIIELVWDQIRWCRFCHLGTAVQA